MTKYLTIPEFASALGVSRWTIQREIKKQTIKAVKKNPLGGKTSPLMIPVEELTRLKKLRNGKA